MFNPRQLACFLRLFALPLLLAPSVLGASPRPLFPGGPVLALPQGLGPVATLSPTSVNFGSQAVGTSSTPVPVTLTNTGDSNLIVSGVKLSGVNRADFSQTNNCRTSLVPQASCTINVTFTPSAAGSRAASLMVTDNAADSPQSVSLAGTGIAPAVQLSAGSLSFGTQLVGTTSGPQGVSITNSGTAPLIFTGFTVTGDFAQTNNCGSSLGSAGVCTVSVTFSPSAGWGRGGNLVIADNANGSPQVVVLVGMGYAGATASLSANSIVFGSQSVGTTATKSLNLTNNGSAALSVNGIFASGDYAQSNNCPGSLNPGSNCTVTVSFTPMGAGRRLGRVTLLDTDPSLLQSVSLTGTGTVPSSTVSISPRAASLTLTQTQQFTASISGQVSSNVTWSVDGIAGGNSTSGTISAAGLYTPPPTAGAHSVSAASIADPTQTANVLLVVTDYPGTFIQKNDTLRTGQNLQETVLTTSNVNQYQFGKLFSCPVDGYIYAQPLYVENLSLPGQGPHNVVYVATENDSVYAFDADNNPCQTLWYSSLLNPGFTAIPRALVEKGNDLTPIIGITATPVIDPTTNTMFVLARSVESAGGNTFAQNLYALDITTGAQRPGSPVLIQPPPVSGKGEGSSGGQLSFDPKYENPRTGLLLANGVVYLAWGSLEDQQPFHGWVMGFNETTLQLVADWVSTPNGNEGGIWQGGGGLAADASGNIFLATGNGTFDANTGGLDYGSSVVKLTNTGSALVVADYCTPFNQAFLTSMNWDLGAGGTVLLPDQPGPYPHLALAGGKGSTIYLLNRDNLGQFNPAGNQVLLTLPAAVGPVTEEGGSRGGPAYWQGLVYYSGAGDDPKQFAMSNGMISALPVAKGPIAFGYPGAAPVISANGNTNGILWLLQVDQYGKSLPAVLRALDAANIAHQLYSQPTTGAAVKFTVPTVANGKVYVGTQTELDVFGLLP